MSLLRSYGFGLMCGVDELPTEVLNLFIGLSENPEKKIEYASEIISAGLQGRIKFDGNFNIDAYEAAIRKNLKLGKEHRRKKESFIDFSDNNAGDWDDVSSSGGLKVDAVNSKAVEKMEDAYEQLLAEDELRYAVETIRSLENELLVECKIDFIHTMQQALKGIPESIQLLQKVCDEYEIVAEQVRIILSSGYTFEEVFA